MLLKHDSANTSALFPPLFVCWSVKTWPSLLTSAQQVTNYTQRGKADCKNRQNTSVVCQSSGSLLTVVEWKGPEVLFPKPHMEAISVAVRTGTSPSFSSPTFPLLLFGMHHHSIIWELIKEAVQQSTSPIT